MWNDTKPMGVFEKPLHSPKVTVWCGLSSYRLYGPFFFEDTQTGNACTVTTATYFEMLETFMRGYLHPDIWFQQDCPTAHTLKARAWVKSRFGNKVISHLTDFPWLARSPDLSLLDFFLQGYLKENVFRRKPFKFDTLKEAIREILSSIDQDTMAAVNANFEKTCEHVYSTAGWSLYIYYSLT